MTTFNTFSDIPKTYNELVAVFVPRPIADDVDLDNATEIVDQMAGRKLNHDQADFLNMLSLLIEQYEDEHYPVAEDVSGIELLRLLLEENDMNATDLACELGLHQTHGYKILSGKRGLTVVHIKTLATRFAVAPGALMR